MSQEKADEEFEKYLDTIEEERLAAKKEELAAKKEKILFIV